MKPAVTAEQRRILDAVARTVAPRLRALEQRLTQLESKSLADAFAGPYLPNRTYKRGAIVQRQGLWLALEDTAGKPGACAEWKLLVKEPPR